MPSGHSLAFLLCLTSLLVADAAEAEEDTVQQITYYNEKLFNKLKNTDSDKANFFLSRFAQAEFEPKCANEQKAIIVPIYYNSGGNVELPCKMCEWAFVTNGEPKTWRHIPLHHVAVFLKDPALFLHNHIDDEDEAYVQHLYKSMTPEGGGFHRRSKLFRRNLKKEGEETDPAPPQTIASIHQFIQADGKLYIHGTMLESSGIYFCYDAKSRNAHTRVFFLLNAMAPLVHHSTLTGSEDKGSLWNVGEWLTSGQKYEAKCEHPAEKIRMPDEFAHMRYTPADLADKRKINLPIDLKHEIHGNLSLEVDYEYGDFTPCRPDEPKQYREVHCVLKRKKGETIPDIPQGNLKFAKSLNSYFNRFETLRLHSYYLTSLIYKGSTYGYQKKSETETCDQRANRLWDAFTEAILPSLLGMTHTKLTEYLDAPDSLAGGRERWKDCFDLNFDGPEGNGWWSIRGISFIEEKSCTATQGK